MSGIAVLTVSGEKESIGLGFKDLIFLIIILDGIMLTRDGVADYYNP